MLHLKKIETYYGDSQALFGMDLSPKKGEVVALIGRNGMGKTTTINSILGITPVKTGHIYLDNLPIHKLHSYQIAHLGISIVPEGRQVFPNLSVRENLLATASNRLNHQNPWTLDSVTNLFTELNNKLNINASVLSGGEQQMLAIGRALMTNPKLLILDEATEGLAPIVCKKIWKCLYKLKTLGLSILIVDKNFKELEKIADRHVFIEKGKDVWVGSSSELQSSPRISKQFLEL